MTARHLRHELPHYAVEAHCTACGRTWRTQTTRVAQNNRCLKCGESIHVATLGRALSAFPWTCTGEPGRGGPITIKPQLVREHKDNAKLLAEARERGLITYAEGAKLLGVEYYSVTTLIHRYSIERERVGKYVMIRREDLMAAWENRRKKGDWARK